MGGVFAILFVTVEGDKGVQDAIKVICRPGTLVAGPLTDEIIPLNGGRV